MGIKVRVKKNNSDKVIVVDTEPKETPKAKAEKKKKTTSKKTKSEKEKHEKWLKYMDYYVERDNNQKKKNKKPSIWEVTNAKYAIRGRKDRHAKTSKYYREYQKEWANDTGGLPDDFFDDIILYEDVLDKLQDDVSSIEYGIGVLTVALNSAKTREESHYYEMERGKEKRRLEETIAKLDTYKNNFGTISYPELENEYYRNALEGFDLSHILSNAEKYKDDMSEMDTKEYKYLLKLKDFARLSHISNVNKELKKYYTERADSDVSREKNAVREIEKGNKYKIDKFLQILNREPIEKRHSGNTSFKNDYDSAKEYAQRYAEAKAKQLLAGITKNNKALMNKAVPRPTKTYAKSTLKKISTSQGVVPQSVMEIRGIANVFNPSVIVKVARHVKLTEGKIPKTIPASFKTRFTKSSDKDFLDKIKGRIALGKLYFCVIAATFFQILVSNTPIDDFYKYKTKELRKGKRLKLIDKSPDAEGGLSKVVRFNEELEDDINERMKVVEVEKTHKPDDISVRADWVLHFKGKSFKAYKSTAAKGSRKPRVGAYFSKEDFMVKTDTNSINKLALILYEATKDSKNENNNFTYENVNPRWEMLEYGGYKNNSDAKTGSRYGFQHGVSSHYTYQAPRGFVRLTEAYYNQLITSGRGRGFVSSFLQTNSKQLNVTDVKKIPELIKVLSKTYDRESMVGIKQ